MSKIWRPTSEIEKMIEAANSCLVDINRGGDNEKAVENTASPQRSPSQSYRKHRGLGPSPRLLFSSLIFGLRDRLRGPHQHPYRLLVQKVRGRPVSGRLVEADFGTLQREFERLPTVGQREIGVIEVR